MQFNSLKAKVISGLLAVALTAGSGAAIVNNNFPNGSPIAEASVQTEKEEEEAVCQMVLTLTDENENAVTDSGDYTYALAGNTSYQVLAYVSGNTPGYIVFRAEKGDTTYKTSQIKSGGEYTFTYVPESDESVHFSLATDTQIIPYDALVITNNGTIGEKKVESAETEEYYEDDSDDSYSYDWSDEYESSDENYTPSYSSTSEAPSGSTNLSDSSSSSESSTTSSTDAITTEEEYTGFNPDTDDPQMYFHDCLGAWTAQDYIDHGYDPPCWMQEGWTGWNPNEN